MNYIKKQPWNRPTDCGNRIKGLDQLLSKGDKDEDRSRED